MKANDVQISIQALLNAVEEQRDELIAINAIQRARIKDLEAEVERLRAPKHPPHPVPS